MIFRQKHLWLSPKCHHSQQFSQRRRQRRPRNSSVTLTPRGFGRSSFRAGEMLQMGRSLGSGETAKGWDGKRVKAHGLLRIKIQWFVEFMVNYNVLYSYLLFFVVNMLNDVDESFWMWWRGEAMVCIRIALESQNIIAIEQGTWWQTIGIPWDNGL